MSSKVIPVRIVGGRDPRRRILTPAQKKRRKEKSKKYDQQERETFSFERIDRVSGVTLSRFVERCVTVRRARVRAQQLALRAYKSVADVMVHVSGWNYRTEKMRISETWYAKNFATGPFVRGRRAPVLRAVKL